MRILVPALLGAVGFPSLAFAELPLTVEGLITDQNRWRAELAVNYANAEQRGLSTGQPIMVQVGPAQFVAVPTQFGASRINSDTVVVSPGLRYGMSAKTELYGRASWLSDRANIQDVNGVASQSSNRFDSLWLGLNHQLVEEGKTPALLGFIEGAALEKTQLPGSKMGRNFSGRSWLIGATTYRAIDPIVLSLTAAYRINAARTINTQRYAPGNYLLLNPSVSFAVNSDITLSGGLQWRNVQTDVLNAKAQGISRTSTDLTLGLAWSWDERSILNFSSKANLSGNGGVDLGLTWTYKMGDLPKPKRGGKPASS